MTRDLNCYSFIQDHIMRIALCKHMENMKFDHAYVKEKDNLVVSFIGALVQEGDA